MATPGGVMAADSGGQQTGCRQSFHLITFFGIPIRVHVLLPVCMLASGLSAALGTGGYMPAIIMALLVSGPLLFATVLVHEFGHMAASVKCGCKPDHILLWPLGGLYLYTGTLTNKERIFVAAMGPLTHLPQMAWWAILLAVINKGHVALVTHGYGYTDHFVHLVAIAMLANNLAMLLFNLLVPCFPLDCSQIFVSAMLACGNDPSVVAKTLTIVSIPVLCALVALAFWSYAGGGGPTAFLNILMAFWLARETYNLHQARVNGNLGSYPLFAAAQQSSAGASTRSSSSAGVQLGGMGARSWKPFQGDGVTLGRPANPPPGNQACIAGLLSMAIALHYACQAAPPPGL